jgi:hypothetical protein
MGRILATRRTAVLTGVRIQGRTAVLTTEDTAEALTAAASTVEDMTGERTLSRSA